MASRPPVGDGALHFHADVNPSALRPRNPQRSAELLLLFTTLIWAVNYPVTKFGLERLDIFVFNSIRYVVAFALLTGLLAATRQWFRVPREDRGPLIRLGVLTGIVYQLAFIVGINLTTAGNTAVLLSTSPLWTALIQARITRTRIRSAMIAGLLVSLTGIVMIVLGSGKRLEFASHAILGDLVCIAAALFWALSTNLQKPLLRRYSTVQLSVVTLGIGAVGLSVMAIPSWTHFHWSEIPFPYVAAALASGALSIGLANVIWTYGVEHIGPSRTASFNNLVPILAFIISYLVLDERVTVLQIVGAVITIAGVWISRR